MIGLATFLMLLISLTFNMSLWCYIGDLLMEKVRPPLFSFPVVYENLSIRFVTLLFTL